MGKTVYLVDIIERLLRAKKTVYSTIEIKFQPNSRLQAFFKYIPPEEIMNTLSTLREGEVVMDEIQAYLNSRKWDSLPIDTQVFLQQHRKRGLNIYGACQSVRRADVVFRELVQIFLDIRKIFVFNFWGHPLGLFIIREYDPDTMESQTKNYEQIGWPKFRLLDSTTFHLYDTTQEYSPAFTTCKKCFEIIRVKKECKYCHAKV